MSNATAEGDVRFTELLAPFLFGNEGAKDSGHD